jgi:hypothetical protein
VTTAGTDGDSNGTTLGDLINFVNGFGRGSQGAVDKIPGGTLSLNGSHLVLTADTPGTTTLAMCLSDDGANQGMTNFGCFTVTTAGSDALPGSNPESNATNTLTQSAFNTQTLNTHSTREVIAHTGTQPIEVSQQNEILLDLDKIRTVGSVQSTQDFGSQDPSTNPTTNTQSFQVARANAGPATNSLTQDATDIVDNTVVADYLWDLRRISTLGGAPQTATLTPRSMTIQVRSNNMCGNTNEVLNTGTAVQRQALVQISEGGVDESGKSTGNGGDSSNTATQQFQHTDTTAVTQTTNILI